MFLTKADELNLRSCIVRQQMIAEMMEEGGFDDPAMISPDAAADYESGTEAAKKLVAGALPAVRMVAFYSVRQFFGQEVFRDYWKLRNIKDQAMQYVYDEALSLAFDCDNIPGFMSAVLGIKKNLPQWSYTPGPEGEYLKMPFEDSPEWEKAAVLYGSKGRYPEPFFGRETAQNVDEYIDVIADNFVFARSLSAVAPAQLVDYAIKTFGLDRGYPRDEAEVCIEMGITASEQRSRKRALRELLSDKDVCAEIKNKAGRWYLSFGIPFPAKSTVFGKELYW